MAAPLILCFRRDLRLADQPALAAALADARAAGTALIPVFVHETEGEWPPGAASRWWLHHSLAALDAALRARGARLLLRRGPLAAARRALAAAGAELRLFTGDGLHAPDRLRNAQGEPYRVFTPFWKALAALPASLAAPAASAATDAWRRQLAWRDFARHLLWHFPGTARDPLDARFERFPWREDPAALTAWQRGETGYPLVDAGMRELWATGWMHNRVRMVVASFLTKHLLIDWRQGARWFWDTLVDADLANNTFGWQWTAGCGADAAPYFRVFNPTLQAQRFDAQGEYSRRWCPEPAPRPIVEHGAARGRALAAYGSITEKVRMAEEEK